MCVIAYKPVGVAVPSEDVLHNCFLSNPHGAGVAIIHPGATSVEVHKGFMKFDDLRTFVNTNVTQFDAVAYHFRITTAGGTSPGNCHPFPVSSDVNALKALDYTARFVLMHNGILGKGDEKAGLSDTQLYVRDKLAPRNIRSIESVKRDVAAETVGSRVLLMDGMAHDVEMTGTGWVQGDKTAPGMWFSNDSFKGWERSFHSKSDAMYPSDYDICRMCGGDVELISVNHDIFECMECGTLYNADMEELQMVPVAQDYPLELCFERPRKKNKSKAKSRWR